MPAARDRDQLLAALDDAFDGFWGLVADLNETDLARPSEVPAWTIKDNISHVIGTESMLLDRPAPAVEVPDAPHLRNDIAKFNEAWIIERRDRPGSAVLTELQEVFAERRKVLESMSQADFDAESFTPAGQDTYGRFMQIRVFDIWIHEQDCRTPLECPGHLHGPAVESSIDEMVNSLGYVFGKKAGAADGQSLRLELTGPATRTIHVAVDGRAGVVDHVDDPTTTITLPTSLWFRWIAGRRPGDPDSPDVTIEGDEALAEAVIANCAYTI